MVWGLFTLLEGSRRAQRGAPWCVRRVAGALSRIKNGATARRLDADQTPAVRPA
jgi:hypothetical protein